MKDRFDLETYMMSAWITSDDIDTLYEHYGEHSMSEDEVMNSLLGIKQLHDMRMQRLLSCFELLIKERKIT
jgi:hypothetical protein